MNWKLKLSTITFLTIIIWLTIIGIKLAFHKLYGEASFLLLIDLLLVTNTKPDYS